jgi:hypothetical protein
MGPHSQLTQPGRVSFPAFDPWVACMLVVKGVLEISYIRYNFFSLSSLIGVAVGSSSISSLQPSSFRLPHVRCRHVHALRSQSTSFHVGGKYVGYSPCILSLHTNTPGSFSSRLRRCLSCSSCSVSLCRNCPFFNTPRRRCDLKLNRNRANQAVIPIAFQ